MCTADTADKRIVMVELAGKGGICHYTFNLCRELSRLTGVILLTGAGYELSSRGPAFAVKEMFDRFRTSPLFIIDYLRIISDRKVQAVHFQLSQHPSAVLLLCAAAKMAGKRIIVTAHNVVSHEEKSWEMPVYAAIYRLSDTMIVHARKNREEAARIFSMDPARISVVPHGDYMFFNDEPTAVPSPDGEATILFFGYIRPYKGLKLLIRAMEKVRRSVPEARLTIAGDPKEDFGPYREEIRRRGLESCVDIHLGYVPFDEVRGYFIRAHVVVLPYEKVSQSGVIQLAYGFGRPVVVTDVGGLPEAVDDGKSGFVVSAGDDGALAGRLVSLLKDRDLQKTMGGYALGLARTRFAWDRIARTTVSIYDGR